jgi:hypothetical protein
MKFLKILLPSVGIAGVGIVTMLLCLPASAQGKSSLPSTPSMGTTSALGGPITPTQPDFFADTANLSISAASDKPGGTISLEPLTRSADRRPAPMVGDPPRPVGGFLKVDLE